MALIGFHGQTILHRPEQHWTWQIGDGALLARLTGIDVVNDFRSADVKAGGQGAPLMPLYHAALARESGLAEPLVVVNIGGVAQVTYISGDLVLAFDTGPGNAPIDDWMQRHTGRPVDRGRRLCRARGKVNDAALDKMLANPFFARVPPKSLDRMDFGMEAVEGPVAGRRRRDADRLHRRLHRAGARAFSRSRRHLDRQRRRPAQHDPDGAC